MNSPGKTALWAGRALSLLAALPFLLSAAMKFAGGSEVIQGFEHLGWPVAMIITLAVLELVGAVLYLIPPFAFLGAILLTGYLGGAIATHVRLGEPVYAHIAIGLFIWGGLFLREPRLRVLLPVWADECLYDREIEINRPLGEVFAYLRYLKNFPAWNPFLKTDPGARVDYTGTDGQPGFILAWNGNRSGAGEQEITRVIDGEKIEFELRFKKPFQATNTGYFAVRAEEGGKTKVNWGMYSKPLFPMTVFGLFFRVKKMMDSSFDSGLKELKSILEK